MTSTISFSRYGSEDRELLAHGFLVALLVEIDVVHRHAAPDAVDVAACELDVNVAAGDGLELHAPAEFFADGLGKRDVKAREGLAVVVAQREAALAHADDQRAARDLAEILERVLVRLHGGVVRAEPLHREIVHCAVRRELAQRSVDIQRDLIAHAVANAVALLAERAHDLIIADLLAAAEEGNQHADTQQEGKDSFGCSSGHKKCLALV